MTMPPAEPGAQTGFPDLFVYGLLAQLQSGLADAPDFPSLNYFSRPLRPSDPNLSVCVFEADMEPVEYEIGQMSHGTNGNPSLLRWNVGVQILVKSAEEQEGRSLRAKLLNRVRTTLFSNVCAAALMTLNDPISGERCTKYRLRRIAFANGDLGDQKAKYFIGQAEVYFDTEYH